MSLRPVRSMLSVANVSEDYSGGVGLWHLKRGGGERRSEGADEGIDVDNETPKRRKRRRSS